MSGGIRVLQVQNPAQWNYSIDANGNARAFYPGIVDWAESAEVQGYTNVAAMQAATIASLITMTQTKGYYTEGDGGGAVYVRGGGAGPGAVQSADGSWWQLVPERTTVNPLQFGCRANGTNDSAPFLAALSFGLPVDGGGRTYTFSTQVSAPANFRGLFNARFQWLDNAAMGQQTYLLNIVDVDGFWLDNLKFDIGNRQNCGSAGDSGRGGLRVTSSSPGVLFNDNVSITNIEAWGDGNGTRIYIRNCKNSFFDKLHARNGIAAFTPDPTNDCINGIDISQCYDCQIGFVQSHDFQVVLATVPTLQFSRAILFFELNRTTIGGTLAYNTAQGVDLSGAIVAVTSPNGNNWISWGTGVVYNVYDWGYKFANVAHDVNASNLQAFAFGRSGFVFSGQSAAPAAGQSTARITLTNCTAKNPSRAGAIGFRALEQAADTTWPRSIRLVGCNSFEDNSNGFLNWAYFSDVTYDGSSRRFNELSSCRGYGFVNGFNSGWTTYSCRVNGTGSQLIPNNVATDILWDAEVYDTARMHSLVSNTAVIEVPMPGYYRVICTGYFNADATGDRRIDILVNGAVTPGGTIASRATSAGIWGGSVSVDVYLVPTDNVRVAVTQTSGSSINFNRQLSAFSVSLIEAF